MEEGREGEAGETGEAGANDESGAQGARNGEAGEPNSSTGGAFTSGGTSGAGTGGTNGAGTGGTSSPVKFCDLGKFDSNANDDELTCLPWSVCPPGTYVHESGNYTHDQVCEPCPSETFSEITNAPFCKEARRCTFAQEIASWPTPTTDRVCADADLFAPYHWDDGETGGLVVTDRGVYLLAHSSAEHDVFVVRYSLEGESLEPWNLVEGVADMADIGDMTHLGDDIYVVGLGAEAPSGEDTFARPGFVKKFSSDSGLVWDEPLGTGSERFEALRIATHDGKLYVIAGLRANAEAPLETVLYVLDATGELLSERTLTPGDGDPPSFDVAVTASGQVFVATDVISDPPADPQKQVVRRFDETGELFFEYPIYDSLWAIERSFVRRLVAGSDVDAHTLVAELSTQPPGSVEFPVWQYTFHHLGTNGGWGSSGITLELGDVLSAFASGYGGFIAVGQDVKGAPLLVRLDYGNQVVSREAVEGLRIDDQIPFSAGFGSGITGLEQAQDGTVFVGGVIDGGVFVTPWPE
jgi:hypothetical protein